MLQVGQELWYVPADRRNVDQARTVRVEKVGRKWAKLNDYHGQVSIETMWLDGGKYSPLGKCWLSKEAWEAEIKLNATWNDFQRRLSHQPPDGVTLETIAQIKTLLGWI